MNDLSPLEDDRLAELMAKARLVVDESGGTSNQQHSRQSRRMLALGAVVLVGLAAGGVLLSRRSPAQESTLTAPPTTVATVITSPPAPSLSAPPTAVLAPATTTPADTTLALPTTVPVPATTLGPEAAPVAAPVVAAVPQMITGAPSERLPGGQLWPFGLYQDDVMYLRGTVPDIDISSEIQRRAEEILGAQNVRNELVIDPTVPQVETVVVRLGNSVLFTRGDFDIPPESEPGFVLWGAFLQSNPDVTLTVIGHADAQGSPDENLALAQRRAEVAAERIVRNGIDPARVTAVSHGEDDPIATNATVEGRALNRRVEFAVTGLFT